jgi:hypothetical protein
MAATYVVEFGKRCELVCGIGFHDGKVACKQAVGLRALRSIDDDTNRSASTQRE